MSEQIDKEIAGLEKELAGLRRQKLAELQSQVAALQAALGGDESVAPRRGRPRGKTAAAAGNSDAVAPARRKRRGRKLGKRITDADALAKLSKVISAAGSEGVSGKKAAQTSGVSYPRAIGLMDKHFKKRGSGRWTRYSRRDGNARLST